MTKARRPNKRNKADSLRAKQRALASKGVRNLRVYLFSLAKADLINGDASKRANASEVQGVLRISRHYATKL
jgi:hypothetical protein